MARGVDRHGRATILMQPPNVRRQYQHTHMAMALNFSVDQLIERGFPFSASSLPATEHIIAILVYKITL